MRTPPFEAKLSGRKQSVTMALGAGSVTDATGGTAGYGVAVAFSAPTVDGLKSASGTGGSLTVTRDHRDP